MSKNSWMNLSHVLVCKTFAGTAAQKYQAWYVDFGLNVLYNVSG